MYKKKTKSAFGALWKIFQMLACTARQYYSEDMKMILKYPHAREDYLLLDIFEAQEILVANTFKWGMNTY